MTRASRMKAMLKFALPAAEARTAPAYSASPKPIRQRAYMYRLEIQSIQRILFLHLRAIGKVDALEAESLS